MKMLEWLLSCMELGRDCGGRGMVLVGVSPGSPSFARDKKEQPGLSVKRLKGQSGLWEQNDPIL